MPLGVSLSQIRTLPEAAPIYRWQIQFDRPPAAGVVVPTPDRYNMQCVSSAIPKRDAGSGIELIIRGHMVRLPGTYADTKTIDLTFFDTEDNIISEYLASWREAMWHYDTGRRGGSREDVTADISLIRLSNQDEPIWQYHLFGCYQEDYDPSGAELGADAEIMRPTLTLYYDFFTDDMSVRA